MFSNTDRDWEYYGKQDPYYGVITHDQYRSKNLNKEALKDFFDTGDQYISEVISQVQKYIEPNFSPQKILDFGCGVGRLVVPLARKYKFVLGVDISSSMLQEAKKNCNNLSLNNVEFMRSDDSLSQLHETFDFIHSYIVFQHIPTNRGKKLFTSLLQALSPGGVGVLHFTYKCSPLKRFYDWVPFSNIFYSFYAKKPITDRPIQMNEYNLNWIFSSLQNSECNNLHITFTRHGKNNDGVIIYFQKSSS